MFEKNELHLNTKEKLIQFFNQIQPNMTLNEIIKKLEIFEWHNLHSTLHEYHENRVIFYSLVEKYQPKNIYGQVLLFLTAISQNIGTLPLSLMQSHRKTLNELLELNEEIIAVVIHQISHVSNFSLVTWLLKKYPSYFQDLLFHLSSMHFSKTTQLIIRNLKESRLLENVIFTPAFLRKLSQLDIKDILQFTIDVNDQAVLEIMLQKYPLLLNKIIHHLQQFSGEPLYQSISEVISKINTESYIADRVREAMQANDEGLFMDLLKLDSDLFPSIKFVIRNYPHLIKPSMTNALIEKEHHIFKSMLHNLSPKDWVEILKDHSFLKLLLKKHGDVFSKTFSELLELNEETVAPIIHQISHKDNFNLIVSIVDKFPTFYHDLLLHKPSSIHSSKLTTLVIKNLKETNILGKIVISPEFLKKLSLLDIKDILQFIIDIDDPMFFDLMLQKYPLLLIKFKQYLQQAPTEPINQKISEKISALDMEWFLYDRVREAFEAKDQDLFIDFLELDSELFPFVKFIIRNHSDIIKPLLAAALIKGKQAIFTNLLHNLSLSDWVEILNDHSFLTTLLHKSHANIFIGTLNPSLLKLTREYNPLFFLKILNHLLEENNLYLFNIYKDDFSYPLFKDFVTYALKEQLYQSSEIIFNLDAHGLHIFSAIVESNPRFISQLLWDCLENNNINLFYKTLNNVSAESLIALLEASDAILLKDELLRYKKMSFLKLMIDININILRINSFPYRAIVTEQASLLQILCNANQSYSSLLTHIKDRYFPVLSEQEQQLIQKALGIAPPLPTPSKRELFSPTFFSIQQKRIKPSVVQVSFNLNDLELLGANLTAEEKSTSKFSYAFRDSGIDKDHLNIFLYRTLYNPLLKAGIILMPVASFNDKIPMDQLKTFFYGGKIPYLTHIYYDPAENIPIIEDEQIPPGNKFAIWPIFFDEHKYKLFVMNLIDDHVFFLDSGTNHPKFEEKANESLTQFVENLNLSKEQFNYSFLNHKRFSSEYLIAFLTLLANRKLSITRNIDFRDLQATPLSTEMIEKIHCYQISILGNEFANKRFSSGPDDIMLPNLNEPIDMPEPMELVEDTLGDNPYTGFDLK